MEVEAKAKQVRISARKARLVAKVLRGLNPVEALTSLKFIDKKAAPLISKVIKTAMSDAVHNFKISEKNLRIKEVVIEDGVAYKRWKARSRGMANPIKKRTAHIRVKLEEVAK